MIYFGNPITRSLTIFCKYTQELLRICVQKFSVTFQIWKIILIASSVIKITFSCFFFSFKLEEKWLKLLSGRIQRLLYPHIELHLISVLFHGGKFRKAYQFSVQFCFRRDSKLQVISRFCSYLLQQFYKKTLQSRTATKSDVAQIFVWHLVHSCVINYRFSNCYRPGK